MCTAAIIRVQERKNNTHISLYLYKYLGSRNKMLKIKVGWNEGNRVTRGPSVNRILVIVHFSILKHVLTFFKKKKRIRMNWQDLL